MKSIDDETYNISYVGIEGLIDRIVIEVADSFRTNLRRWVRYTKKKDETKANKALEKMWVDLAWFISGHVEELYPNENVCGGKIYQGLLTEFKIERNKLDTVVKMPQWLLFMEESYYEQNNIE